MAGHSVAAKLPCYQEEKLAGSDGDRTGPANFEHHLPIELIVSYRLDGGAWVELARTPPRDMNTPTYSFIDAPLLGGETVEIKYDWSHRWVTDFLPLVVPASESPLATEITARSAVHSTTGECAGILAEGDNEFCVLREGERLDLTFARGTRPSPLKDRFFFLSAKGYYSAWLPGSSPTLPSAFALHSGYPNPFNAQTRIEFALPYSSDINIKVFNVLGRCVKTLVAGPYAAGEHSVTWDGSDDHGTTLASGTYLIRMRSGSFEELRKMTLLK